MMKLTLLDRCGGKKKTKLGEALKMLLAKCIVPASVPKIVYIHKASFTVVIQNFLCPL